MSVEGSISVVVYEEKTSTFGNTLMGMSRPFHAFVASNPKLRADGSSEEEALTRLRVLVLSHIPHDAKSVKLIDLQFGGLIASEVLSE